MCRRLPWCNLETTHNTNSECAMTTPSPSQHLDLPYRKTSLTNIPRQGSYQGAYTAA
ncbi:hypothetical protein SK128_000348, partial [Halocaridina rubra]